jgi:hypothetical protein
MGRLKRRFFLWLGDQIQDANDERGERRRQAARAAMLRPQGQPWFKWKLSDCVWLDEDGKPVKR